MLRPACAAPKWVLGLPRRRYRLLGLWRPLRFIFVRLSVLVNDMSCSQAVLVSPSGNRHGNLYRVIIYSYHDQNYYMALLGGS